MNKNQQEIKNAMGQLEASLLTAGKFMLPDEYEKYCKTVYKAISMLAVRLKLPYTSINCETGKTDKTETAIP